MEQIVMKNVTFRYPTSEAPALNDLSLTVREGELLVICGRSGCGKTTLLRLLKPRLAPHGELCGEITFRGEPLSALSERDSAAKISFVSVFLRNTEPVSQGRFGAVRRAEADIEYSVRHGNAARAPYPR